MSIELIIITVVSAFNLVCSIILLTMYKNAMTELNELKKVKTEVEEIISVIALDETAFEPIKEKELKSERRSNFKFSMIGLKPGNEITCYGRSAKVYDDNRIIYNGEIRTLGSSAKEIYTEEHGGQKPKTLSGTDYWKYNNETLYNIRKRMENKQ